MIKETKKRFSLTTGWRRLFTVLSGVLAGFLILVVYLSNAVSYLSDEPETCINCHLMIPQYSTWFNSSHRERATCNDCHVPHDNVFRKYLFKGMDGTRHATYFTLRWEPQVIKIKEAGIGVVQENCIRCHSDMLHEVSASKVTGESYKTENDMLCWNCHREVPHGRIHSQSSTPYSTAPQLTKPFPEWFTK
jgi:cytochrome c nitrite reductase small subunit